MRIVQKGNKQLRVADDRLRDMLKSGYVEIDRQTGKPIVAETDDAKAEKAMKREIAALKKENKELAERVSALTAQLEAAGKAE